MRDALLAAILMLSVSLFPVVGPPCPNCDHIPAFDGSDVQLKDGAWYGWRNPWELRKARQEALLRRIQGPQWEPAETKF